MLCVLTALVASGMLMNPPVRKQAPGRQKHRYSKTALWNALKDYASPGEEYVTQEQLKKAYQTKDKYGQALALPPMSSVNKEVDINKDGTITKAEMEAWRGYEERAYCRNTGDRAYGCLDRCIAGIDRANGFPGYFDKYKQQTIPGFEMDLGNVGAGTKIYNGQFSEAQQHAVRAAIRASKAKGNMAILGVKSASTWHPIWQEMEAEDFEGSLHIVDGFMGMDACDHAKDTGMCPEAGSGKMSQEFLKHDIDTWRNPNEKELQARKSKIVVHAKKFGELVTQDLGHLSFAFLDGSIYPTMLEMLKVVEKLMLPGGQVFVHDFGWEGFPGIEKAVADSGSFTATLPATTDGVACYAALLTKK